MGNDVTIIGVIVGSLLLLAFFVPIIQEEFGEEVTSYNTDIAPANVSTSWGLASIGIGGNSVGSSLLASFLWTYSWMPAWLAIFHIIIRVILAILIYRLIRSGGG